MPEDWTPDAAGRRLRRPPSVTHARRLASSYGDEATLRSLPQGDPRDYAPSNFTRKPLSSQTYRQQRRRR